MPPNYGAPSDLSETQRVLVQSAVRNGHFEIPREVSTVALAEKNEMSCREASAEMNRALEVVLHDADLGE